MTREPALVWHRVLADAALAAALSHQGPALVELVTDAELV